MNENIKSFWGNLGLATINIRRGSVIGSTLVDMVVAPQSSN